MVTTDNEMRGLVIQGEFLDLILSGKKDWELRGRATRKRGPIALIESGSGTVVGRCSIVDVLGPLSLNELRSNARHLGCRPSEISLYYKKTYAWVLTGAARFKRPVKYQHPQGAVIWVKLSAGVSAKVSVPSKVWLRPNKAL